MNCLAALNQDELKQVYHVVSSKILFCSINPRYLALCHCTDSKQYLHNPARSGVFLIISIFFFLYFSLIKHGLYCNIIMHHDMRIYTVYIFLCMFYSSANSNHKMSIFVSKKTQKTAKSVIYQYSHSINIFSQKTVIYTILLQC